MEEKYLSIITNFGCHFECDYCIVKNNHINVPATTHRSLSNLKAAIESEQANIISVSGGGDPLHDYPKHKKYYNRLLKICKGLNIPIEMHTSYFDSDFPYEKCCRVVYHCRSADDLYDIHRYGKEKTRAMFVVTEKFTPEYIQNIVALKNDLSDEIDELSFRQMIDKNYRVRNYCHDFLKEGHKKDWWYIEQGDYNPYYVNGTIYYQFSDIGS